MLYQSIRTCTLTEEMTCVQYPFCGELRKGTVFGLTGCAWQYVLDTFDYLWLIGTGAEIISRSPAALPKVLWGTDCSAS